MAYTLTVQNYMVTLNGIHDCFKQEYVSTGSGQCLMEKEKPFSVHLSCLCKSSCSSSYSYHWSATPGLGRKQWVLRCKGVQSSVCIDRVDDAYKDELTLNGHETEVGGDEVYELLTIMNNNLQPPTVVTYNVLINGLCKNGRLDCAINFLNQMFTYNRLPDIITYNTLLDALSKEDMVDEAFQLLHLLIGTNCSPSLISYNTVLNGLSKKGYVDEATSLYNQMIQNGILPDDTTQRSLICGFCRSNKFEEAVEMVKGFLKEGYRVNSRSYRYLVHELCINKKVDLAIQVLEMMLSSRCKPNERIYSTIINSIASAGLKEQADELRQKLIEWKVLGSGSSWEVVQSGSSCEQESLLVLAAGLTSSVSYTTPSECSKIMPFSSRTKTGSFVPLR
ncbi:Pentatricopeptide repeat-containing protein, partial [Cucurbita argyrosperma subsp. sororia]